MALMKEPMLEPKKAHLMALWKEQEMELVLVKLMAELGNVMELMMEVELELERVQEMVLRLDLE